MPLALGLLFAGIGFGLWRAHCEQRWTDLFYHAHMVSGGVWLIDHTSRREAHAQQLRDLRLDMLLPSMGAALILVVVHPFDHILTTPFFPTGYRTTRIPRRHVAPPSVIEFATPQARANFALHLRRAMLNVQEVARSCFYGDRAVIIEVVEDFEDASHASRIFRVSPFGSASVPKPLGRGPLGKWAYRRLLGLPDDHH